MAKNIKLLFTRQTLSSLSLQHTFLILKLSFDYKTMYLVENLTNFANNTSIQGLVHIANKKSTKAKRFTWFIIFVLSLMYAGTQIAEEVKCKHTYINKLEL